MISDYKYSTINTYILNINDDFEMNQSLADVWRDDLATYKGERTELFTPFLKNFILFSID